LNVKQLTAKNWLIKKLVINIFRIHNFFVFANEICEQGLIFKINPFLHSILVDW
jgi:hypothetical protein